MSPPAVPDAVPGAVPDPAPDAVPVEQPARRRWPTAVAVLGVLAAGLAVSRGEGTVHDLGGGVLYAALVHLGVLLLAPGVRVPMAAVVALGLCVGVELAQLTPVPARAVAAWPPAAYVLGSTFATWDLPAYAAGVAVATAVDVRRRRWRRQPARAA